MTVLKSVKVGPFLYHIRDDEEGWKQLQLEEQVKDDENWGYTQQKTSTIFINPSVVSLPFKKTILLHELFHAIIFVAGEIFGSKRTVEFIILHIAPLWLATLQDNPQLVIYLMEGVEDVDTGQKAGTESTGSTETGQREASGTG
jgi:hypothetical protein